MTPLWRRPIWLLGHLVALVAVVSFVRLGVWQLDRLDEKQARNRLIAARTDGPAIDIEDVDLDVAEYQKVRARGRFAPAEQVLIRNRSYQGAVGYHVVTPLVLDDGRTVLVNRGWAPLDSSAQRALTPELEELTVEGILRETETRGRVGPRDPASGELEVLNRVDVERVQEQSDRRLLPLWLQLVEPAPPQGELPLVLPPPPRDEGPHRSYAIQWFLFATVVGVGYPILLRRRVHESATTD